MKRLFTTLLVAAVSLSAGAHDFPKDLHTQASQSDLAYKIVESLTMEVGPRIAGSEGDRKAVAWAEAKLNDLGFDKVYKQPVRVRNWSRGRTEAKVLSPHKHSLVITALGGSIATPADGLNAEVVMFDSLQALQAADSTDVRDKIVFINKRMQRDRAGRGYGPVVQGRAQGAIEAAKLGAKAVVIRSVGTDSTRFAHTGAMRYSDEVEKIPAGALSNVDADILEKQFSFGQPVTMQVDIQAKDHGWQTSYNVIGEITGHTYPNEYVLIAAHLDSWDEGTGALDDGAGVGIVTAAAKLVRDSTGQPARSIRVVLYAAEEIGLVGGLEYARANKEVLDEIVIAAESDFGAGKIYAFNTAISEAALNKMTPLVKQFESIGIAFGTNTARGGPDISMLPRHGVPVAELKQDGTYYFDYHHTPNDTLDKIDPKQIRQNQYAYALFTWYMANHPIDTRPAPARSQTK